MATPKAERAPLDRALQLGAAAILCACACALAWFFSQRTPSVAHEPIAVPAPHEELAPIAIPGPRTPEPRRIHITTRPAGAEVLIDGSRAGLSPLDVELPPQGCTLRVTKPGYAPLTKNLTPESPSTLALELTEKHEPPRKPHPNISEW